MESIDEGSMDNAESGGGDGFQVGLFIDMVRQNKCLYELADPDYKKNKLKDDIWSQIGEHSGIAGADKKVVSRMVILYLQVSSRIL